MKKNKQPSFANPRSARARKITILLGGVAVLSLLLAACSAYRGSASTVPSTTDKEFLSEVRYLISKKERKIFKNTPPEERKKFIDEFWKVRDPDPTTDENEFRDEYYRRIDVANHLFHEGSQGWLSDRGRILILLGEPERRDVYPTGYTFYEPPVEIWFYNTFPVIFVDYHREGIYKLDPVSVRRISMINMAQMQLKPQGIQRNVRLFDFALTAQELGPGAAKLLMAVPYRVTNLILDEKSKAYSTQIKMTVRIVDAAGKTALEKEELRTVSVSDDMLAKLGKTYSLEFSLQLPPGKYTAQVSLENTADKSQARKDIQIKL